MADKMQQPAKPVLPSHIILLADWNGEMAGRVLRAEPDLIALLDEQGAKYREATLFERSVGTIAGQ